MPLIIFLVALAGAAVFLIRYKRSGQTVVVDDIDEVTVTAQRVAETVKETAVQIAATVSSWTHPNGERFRALFTAAEKKYSIPNGLLFRQAYQESRFRDDIITGKVRSSAGAVGIMQIIPKFHPSIDPGDAAADERAALDPARAIDYAGKFLAQLRKQFGSWQLALAAYNAGPGNVTKYGGIPPFTETKNYVAQITADVNPGAA